MGNSVSWYDEAEVSFSMFFPEGRRVCKYCWAFCKYEPNYNRYSCKLTGEWLEDIEKRRGDTCPLQFKEV